MKLEYNVQELKYKLQKHIITENKKLKKNYVTYKEAHNDICKKIQIIDEWFDSWDKRQLCKKLVNVKITTKSKYFNLLQEETKTLGNEVTGLLPQLPEGFTWEYPFNNFEGLSIRHVDMLKPYKPQKVVIKNIYLPSFCKDYYLDNYHNQLFAFDDLCIVTPSIPFREDHIKPYSEKLLNKILLAEKHGCVTVVLEDKDLDILMNIG
tara:strand:- start:235 stop:855 length:621 start_codon:yes stop_codon:yes gene_type:complete